MSKKERTILLAIAIVAVILAAFAMTSPYLFPKKFSTQTPMLAMDQPAVAKNVIYMISDGCGFNHVLAADYYQYGETGKQVYQSFPVKIAMATFAIDGSYDPQNAESSFAYVKEGYTDSAAAATAMSSGLKSFNGAIGVVLDDEAIAAARETEDSGTEAADKPEAEAGGYGDASSAELPTKPVVHIAEAAEKQGKATGVVTSVQLSHATPAGFVAHNVSRQNYAEIANEMILDSPLEVIMGAGHPMFDNDARFAEFATDDEERAERYKYVGGVKTWRKLADGKAGADCDGDGEADPWSLVQTKQGFIDLADGDTPKRVVGIPTVHTTLQEKREGDMNAEAFEVRASEGLPSLAQMTSAALNVLDNDPDGFFLMVEGGAIDWAGHDNTSAREIEEQIDFNHTVEAVVEWVETNSSWDETLVIITADHECGYLTGPEIDGKVSMEVVNNGKGNMPGMAWRSDSHTNSLVPFYAKGPLSAILAENAIGEDPVHGAYLDNTVPAKVILDAWQ